MKKICIASFALIFLAGCNDKVVVEDNTLKLFELEHMYRKCIGGINAPTLVRILCMNAVMGKS